MNQQHTGTNTTSASQGREGFGNGELSDKLVELDREELMAVAGGGKSCECDDSGTSLSVSSGDTDVEYTDEYDGVDPSDLPLGGR